jgi:hypothetical protein
MNQFALSLLFLCGLCAFALNLSVELALGRGKIGLFRYFGEDFAVR